MTHRWLGIVVGLGVLAGCGSDEASSAKAETDCVAGGMNSFDTGSADPFWQSEGREDFADYIDATCRQMVSEGAQDGPPDKASAARIAGEVITRMVSSGQIADPR